MASADRCEGEAGGRADRAPGTVPPIHVAGVLTRYLERHRPIGARARQEAERIAHQGRLPGFAPATRADTAGVTPPRARSPRAAAARTAGCRRGGSIRPLSA